MTESNRRPNPDEVSTHQVRGPLYRVDKLIAEKLREAGFEISIKRVPRTKDPLAEQLPEEAHSNLYLLQGTPDAVDAYSRISRYVKIAYEKTPKKTIVAAIGAGILLKTLVDHAKKGETPPHAHGRDFE